MDPQLQTKTYTLHLQNPREPIGIDFRDYGNEVFVTGTVENSAAKRSGITPGAIKSVNGQPITDVNKLHEQVEMAKASGNLALNIEVLPVAPPNNPKSPTLPPFKVPPLLTHFNTHGGTLMYVRFFEKISAGGRDQKRVLCVAREYLLLCGVNSSIRRILPIREIGEVVHQGSSTGFLTLIKTKPGSGEHDILLRHVVSQYNDTPPTREAVTQLGETIKTVFAMNQLGVLPVRWEDGASLKNTARIKKAPGYERTKDKFERVKMESMQRKRDGPAIPQQPLPPSFPSSPVATAPPGTAAGAQHPAADQSFPQTYATTQSPQTLPSLPAGSPVASPLQSQPASPGVYPSASEPPPQKFESAKQMPSSSVGPELGNSTDIVNAAFQDSSFAPPPVKSEPRYPTSSDRSEEENQMSASSVQGPGQSVKFGNPVVQSYREPSFSNNYESQQGEGEVDLAQFLQRAADSPNHPSHYEACSDLGHKLLEGSHGYALDPTSGIKYLRQASGGGDPRATRTLQHLNGDSYNEDPYSGNGSTRSYESQQRTRDASPGSYHTYQYPRPPSQLANPISPQSQGMGGYRSSFSPPRRSVEVADVTSMEQRLKQQEEDLRLRWERAAQGGTGSPARVSASPPHSNDSPNRVTRQIVPGEPVTMTIEVQLDSPNGLTEPMPFDFSACFDEI